jgi:hypothetical protein
VARERFAGDELHFDFRLAGKGPNTSLKNKTNAATEVNAAHRGWSTIGKKAITNHSHQGGSSHRSLSEFLGFA